MILVHMAKFIISISPYVQGKITLKILELTFTSKIRGSFRTEISVSVTSGYVSHAMYLAAYHSYSIVRTLTTFLQAGWARTSS